MSDICFLDTETLGLDIQAPVWEFAAIRRMFKFDGKVQEVKYHCFIDHKTEPWLAQMPEEFATDYIQRFSAREAVTLYQAAELIKLATDGAHIIGAVPNFDTERLGLLMRSRNFTPAWHYHLLDVENIVVGYLAGRGEILMPPWKSDVLSRAIGVEPDDFCRHTAMGDVEWVKAEWDAVMNQDVDQ